MERKGPEGEPTSSMLKTMLLALKAQCAVTKASTVETKQLAVRQLDLPRQVASGFQDQTDHLQTISDDLGQNLLALGRGFEKLGDVLKDLHSRARVDQQEVEARHQKKKMESQNVIFGHIRKGINTSNDNLKNANWSLEEIRTGGANGITGKVDKTAGSLLATVNKNLTTLLELQPEVQTRTNWICLVGDFLRILQWDKSPCFTTIWVFP